MNAMMNWVYLFFLKGVNRYIENVLYNCRKEGAPYHYLCMALIRELTADERTNFKEERHQREISGIEEINMNYNLTNFPFQ